MREQLGEKLTQADIVESEAKQAPGLELARGVELDSIVDVASNLAEKVERNQDVTGDDILKLDEALKHAKVPFGAEGEMVTIGELKKIPDIQNNQQIFREIEEGTPGRESNLTYVTPGIARILSGRMQILLLHNLTFISDEVSEIFGRKIGQGINLYGLQRTSERQITNLCQDGRFIGLDNLQSLTPNLAKVLDEYSEQIYMTDELTKRVKKLI